MSSAEWAVCFHTVCGTATIVVTVLPCPPNYFTVIQTLFAVFLWISYGLCVFSRKNERIFPVKTKLIFLLNRRILMKSTKCVIYAISSHKYGNYPHRMTTLIVEWLLLRRVYELMSCTKWYDYYSCPTEYRSPPLVIQWCWWLYTSTTKFQWCGPIKNQVLCVGSHMQYVKI